jgi:hypothetical protein
MTLHKFQNKIDELKQMSSLMTPLDTKIDFIEDSLK